jgi:hypothetical protein
MQIKQSEQLESDRKYIIEIRIPSVVIGLELSLADYHSEHC